jgi:hypothetical protein
VDSVEPHPRNEPSLSKPAGAPRNSRPRLRASEDAARLRHAPVRPSWTCPDHPNHTEPVPWPCEFARTNLLAEFGRNTIALHLYLMCLMVEAVDDLSDADLPSSILFDRFLGWAR